MSDVEEIKNRISIVELVGEYVRLQKAGSSWRALCPFHNEKTPSFMVSDERRSFHCFGCGKGGDIFTFLMEMEGVDFRGAISQLAQKAGIELKKWDAEDKKKEDRKKRLFEILELAAKWYEKNLWDGKGKDNVLKYLFDRGLENAFIKKFKLGYAPDGWRNILEFLVKRGYKTEEISKTGLLVEKESGKHYDRFRDRIMFPVQDSIGRVVGFSARVAPGGDEKTAKYINTSQTEVYDKSAVLYGLNFAKTEIKKKDEVILVEGNMDVIASHQAGFANTIAVSGTAFSAQQIKGIKRYTENIKMAFDMDPAGQAAARKSARVCLENELNVRIVLLPGGKDAAEVIRENTKIWEKAVKDAREVVEYFFEDAFSRYDAKNPADKKKIAKELLNIVKDIASPVEKSHWIKTLARKIDVSEKVLIEIINKAEKGQKTPTEQKKSAPERAKKDRMLEKRIIGLVLAFPKETEKKRISFRKEDFSGEQEKKIFAEIAKKEKWKNFEEIREAVPDYEARKMIDEAVFEIEAEADGRDGSFFDPAEELAEAKSQLQKMRIIEKIAETTQDIKEAEKKGDRKAVQALMLEFRKLSEKLGK